MIVEYQIMRGKTSGRLYCIHDGMQYQIVRENDSHINAVKTESRLHGRQLGFARGGDFGDELAAYVAACEKIGAPAYYAWRGIVNSLGDHASASPPVKGIPAQWDFLEPYTAE